MSILSAIYGGIAFALSHYLPSTDRKLYSSFVGSFVFICNEYLQEGSFVQSIANPLQFGMKEYFIFYCCKIASLKLEPRVTQTYGTGHTDPSEFCATSL